MAAVKEKSAIELLEEAFHLLRQAPVGLLLLYYVGSLPFLLAVLFFWADMAHSAFAAADCALESLGVAALYLWMVFWQAVFARGLRQRLGGSPLPAWTPESIWRIASLQAFVQSSKLFLLPISLAALVPLAPVFAFYQNAAVLVSDAPGLRALIAQSARRTGFQSRQNWILVPVFLLFGLFVFLNLAITLYILPHLVKMLFGVETTFTRSGVNLLHSTLFASAAGLAWAAVDPLIKAVYVLRCFYGASVATGDDLKAAIVNLRRAAAVVCLVAAFCPLLSAQHTIPPNDLDRSIDRVIRRPEYTWRMPRDTAAPSNPAVRGVVEALYRAFDRVGEWFASVIEWLRDMFREKPRPDDPRGDLRPSQKLRWLLYALIAVLVAAVGILLVRFWRGKRAAKPVLAAPAAPIPDLTDDRLEADKVPEDQWLALAQEWMARGDLRLAVRAFYLATLSYLARHSLVNVQAAKTNRQYEIELRRRTRDKADVARLFSENARVFERAWYGDHAVSLQTVDSFRDNMQRMKACAES
jgi:hypothetical protein